MAAEVDNGKIDILRFDFVAEWKGEGPFHECFASGSAETSQCGIFFSRILGGAEFIEYDVVFLFPSVLEDNGIDAGADIRVDGFPVSSSKFCKHVLCGFDDSGVTGHTGTAEKESFELRLDVVFVVREGPAFVMSLGTDKCALKSLESIANLSSH